MKSPTLDKTKSSQKRQHTLLKSHASQLSGSLTSSLKYESYYSKAESMFGSISYYDKTQSQLQSSLIELHKSIKEIEQEIDKRIDKYYPQLRQKMAEKQYNSDQSVEMLTQEKELRQALIKFQEIQIKNINETQKLYDSKDNVEFAIPMQINQTKKKILQLEKFIHIAEIRQKKKSEDVVKVQKTNLQQFEKIAMFRSNLQIAMIYEVTVNQKQMKIQEKIYDFESKIETLNEKLANLNKIVEERHILVSSNKGLLIMKKQKIQLDKIRQEMIKKIALLKNSMNRNQMTVKNDIEFMKKQIIQKQNRYIVLQKQLQELKKKNQTYLIDESMNKSLRKSISYNYAQTLLKVKQKQKMENPEGHNMNLSSVQQSQLLKPNFKVKKLRNQAHSSISKMADSKKHVKNFTLGDPLLPITLDKTPKKEQKSPNEGSYLRKSNNYRPKSIGRPKDQLQQQIISDY